LIKFYNRNSCILSTPR